MRDAVGSRSGGPQHHRRRLGAPSSTTSERRGEILAAAYFVADLGAIAAWIADPKDVTSGLGLGIPVVLAMGAALGFYVLRRRLPRHIEDAAVLGSLALLGAGMAFTTRPGVFAPYYIWVGFAAPLWFPLRRSLVYVVMSAGTCGIDMVLAGTAAATATWFVITAMLVIAFVVVQFLSRALVEQERLAAVGEMASALGHELRNPLTSLGNALFLVRVAVGEHIGPELDRHLALAERETARASSITEDLMVFVRPRRGVPGPLELHSAVAEVLASSPPPPGVSVELDLDAMSVVGDRDQVVGMLTNLVANAYQAMPGGGTLRIAAEYERSMVRVTVEDSGTGIAEDVLDRVFEPFFTTRTHGTGLGLAIVQRLAEEHGGDVAVESEPGRGTRFFVRLPLAHPFDRPRHVAAPASNGSDGAGR